MDALTRSRTRPARFRVKRVARPRGLGILGVNGLLGHNGGIAG